jgi:hypothetical protein
MLSVERVGVGGVFEDWWRWEVLGRNEDGDWDLVVDVVAGKASHPVTVVPSERVVLQRGTGADRYPPELMSGSGTRLQDGLAPSFWVPAVLAWLGTEIGCTEPRAWGALNHSVQSWNE